MIINNYQHKIKALLQVFKPAVVALCLVAALPSQAQTRQDISLNDTWQSIADEKNIEAYKGFEQTGFSTQKWEAVSVPHNWDQYYGYRRMKHGNLHGYSWYRRTFAVPVKQAGKRYFLFFEGVGSYATVWLNGKKAGAHAGGRTTFTLDVTNLIKQGKDNLLAVRADHPAMIKDLPWVCGGCSDDPGFSEGSQPMGIFRPVHLLVTNPVRVEPFGVHVWNDSTVSAKAATLNVETEVKNYGNQPAKLKVVNKLVDASGKTIAQAKVTKVLAEDQVATIAQQMPNVAGVILWSLENPYLYSVQTEVWQNGKLVDKQLTPYGIRWVKWGMGVNGDGRFYINGKPVFINGIAEYEHLMGKSHAFSPEEIRARVMQVKAAGFNAFRDAHQPHNLAYQDYWDKLGIAWWPQFSAHVWYDTPEFKKEFKQLLVEWVKERRNNPSNVMWGLQNESRIPEAFARECSDLIRKLDPTSSSQRKITTCNGGRGTDWDVPQNWTGTYGGNPLTYSEDLKKQILIGEYGAWRSVGLHTEGPFQQNGAYSEDRMTQLMETKVRLAEAVKDKIAGHYQWLLYSHENPGRTQGGEGLRELDRVGPINYKGLFTPWGQPLDVFYMYRANYAPKDREPMVYIVSHTWPNRWTKPGVKDSITVYSNCDEVELFNDVRSVSLGKKKRGGIGTHFQWDKVDIKYNVLYAVGYVNGKEVAHDEIVLNHLQQAPGLAKQQQENNDILKPAAGYNYVYRINCGGPEYQDSFGKVWSADAHGINGSTSWTDDLNITPHAFGSQQRTFDQISGTTDDKLFQTFRYGVEKLKYNFKVPNGNYRIELFFTEPWYGTGGGLNAKDWRLFDIAVNGETKIANLDIFSEAGYAHAVKKIITAQVENGELTITFPRIKAGQAIISAIAISTLSEFLKVKPNNDELIGDNKSVEHWLDLGDVLYKKENVLISNIPSILYGATWLPSGGNAVVEPFGVKKAVDIYVAMDVTPEQRPQWLEDFDVTGLSLETDLNGGYKIPLFKKRFEASAHIRPGENKGKLKYTIFVVPVSNIEPATDLKKTISYSAATAEIKNDAVKDTMSSKNVVRFIKNTASAAVPVFPGVGDKYTFRIKYYNLTGKVLTAKAKLIAADGTVMNEETLSFKPAAKGKSGTAVTSSGTSINAGNYKLVITGIEAEGLNISSVEMQ